MRQIPASGINLFQLIYILIREYEAKSGKSCLNLSLGNPDLIPDPRLLALKKRFADQSDYDLHTYAEDKNLNGFTEGLIRSFAGFELSDFPHLRATPTGGIKTASAILPLSCGLHLKGRDKFHVVTHLPAYDVMGTWSASYYGAKRIVWPLEARTGMRLDLATLKSALDREGVAKPDLIFVIRPGNPASAGASAAEWKELIGFCIERGIRLANDGAYATLTSGASQSGTPGSAHVPLAQIAKEYPDLEWMELYSVSKSFSDPGQRLGVVVGSKDWIEDFILIKGNTDSGPVPLGMVAYGELFKDQALTKSILDDTYKIYRARLDMLVPALKKIGLRPACETTSGFFTLWQVPEEAFGIRLEDEAKARGCTKAEAFNRLVIDRTGIVGVHFTAPGAPDGATPGAPDGAAPGTPDGATPPQAFIRYAVCTDVLAKDFQARFFPAIESIQPKY